MPTPDPILDELMAEVWADPYCPVELASDGIPWPRERIKVPAEASSEPWLWTCPRHASNAPSSCEDAPWLQPVLVVVEMQPRAWVVNEPGHYRSVLVFLGQCQDCGRVFWGISEQPS